jgi:hypothetical protein
MNSKDTVQYPPPSRSRGFKLFARKNHSKLSEKTYSKPSYDYYASHLPDQYGILRFSDQTYFKPSYDYRTSRFSDQTHSKPSYGYYASRSSDQTHSKPSYDYYASRSSDQAHFKPSYDYYASRSSDQTLVKPSYDYYASRSSDQTHIKPSYDYYASRSSDQTHSKPSYDHYASRSSDQTHSKPSYDFKPSYDYYHYKPSYDYYHYKPAYDYYRSKPSYFSDRNYISRFYQAYSKSPQVNAQDRKFNKSNSITPRYSINADEGYRTPQKVNLLDEREVNYEISPQRFSYGLCMRCGKQLSGMKWCRPCNSVHFYKQTSKWTSLRLGLDKLIIKTQITANNVHSFFEWIPFENFDNVTYLTKGGYSEVYKAIWRQGPITYWDTNTNNWERFGGLEVVLKVIKGSQKNLNEFINEVNKYLNLRILSFLFN